MLFLTGWFITGVMMLNGAGGWGFDDMSPLFSLREKKIFINQHAAESDFIIIHSLKYNLKHSKMSQQNKISSNATAALVYSLNEIRTEKKKKT